MQLTYILEDKRNEEKCDDEGKMLLENRTMF